MKKELRHMLEVVPEGIMIYEPGSNKVFMTNTELKRLVTEYGVEAPSIIEHQSLHRVDKYS